MSQIGNYGIFLRSRWQRGLIEYLLLLLIAAASTIAVLGYQASQDSTDTTTQFVLDEKEGIVQEALVTPGDVLQIGTFRFVLMSPTPSPTLPPGVLPSLTPTPFPPPVCTPETKVAVDFLLDTSGSMRTKILGLKTAVRNFFINNLQDYDLIGAQSFSASVRPLVDIKKKSEQTNFLALISSLDAARSVTLANTFMKDAFAFVKPLVEEAQNNPVNTDYHWALIFFTDGIPSPATQDPTDIVAQIKRDDPYLRIITVGLGQSGVDIREELLRNLASSPSDYYHAPSPDKLTEIYQTIAASLCR